MAQYSIYLQGPFGKDACEAYKPVKKLAGAGKVDIVTITDKQYENIKSYVGKDSFQRKIPQNSSHVLNSPKK